MNLQIRDGSGQETGFRQTITKPHIPTNGNPYYNPSTYTNSHLNYYNKRTPMKPDNFIGFKVLRPDNMFPNMQHKPSALNPPIIVPVMRTQPVLKTFQ